MYNPVLKIILDFNMTQYLQTQITPQKQTLEDVDEDTVEFYLQIPTTSPPNTLNIDVECVLYYCDDAGVCMMKCYVNSLQIDVVSERRDNRQTGVATVKSTCVIGIRRDKPR